MPTSNLHLAPEILALVEGTRARRLLDVGPGHGKYGILCREYAGVTFVDAVEKWEPYIAQFGLEGIYATVHRGDVCDLSTDVLGLYDTVLMGDVIEHIDKGRALGLLGRIPGWVVICTPEHFFPQDHEVPTEHHVSHWTAADFEAMRRTDVVKVHLGGVLARLRPKEPRDG